VCPVVVPFTVEVVGAVVVVDPVVAGVLSPFRPARIRRTAIVTARRNAAGAA
jgi:hypothetical protein